MKLVVDQAFPPLDSVLRIDCGQLAGRLAEIPDDLNAILRLVDGRRTIEQVIEEGDRKRLDAAGVVAKLLAERIVRAEPQGPAPRSAAIAMAVEREGAGWFAGPACAPAGGADLDRPPHIVRFPAKPGAARLARSVETRLDAALDGGPESRPLPPPVEAAMGRAVSLGGRAAAEPRPGPLSRQELSAGRSAAARVRTLPRTSWRVARAAVVIAALAGGAYAWWWARWPAGAGAYRVAFASAETKRRAGDAAGAVDAYRTALALRETSAAWTGLGRALYEARDADAALRALERATEVDASDAEAYMALGDVCRSEKRLADARRAYERFLALAPDGRRAQEIRAALAAMRNRKE